MTARFIEHAKRLLWGPSFAIAVGAVIPTIPTFAYYSGSGRDLVAAMPPNLAAGLSPVSITENIGVVGACEHEKRMVIGLNCFDDLRRNIAVRPVHGGLRGSEIRMSGSLAPRIASDLVIRASLPASCSSGKSRRRSNATVIPSGVPMLSKLPIGTGISVAYYIQRDKGALDGNEGVSAYNSLINAGYHNWNSNDSVADCANCGDSRPKKGLFFVLGVMLLSGVVLSSKGFVNCESYVMTIGGWLVAAFSAAAITVLIIAHGSWM